jgi:hypothetical protein
MVVLEAEEVDILLDRKGALCVSYLSSGMDYGVRTVEANLGQSLEILQTEKGFQRICQTISELSEVQSQQQTNYFLLW